MLQKMYPSCVLRDCKCDRSQDLEQMTDLKDSVKDHIVFKILNQVEERYRVLLLLRV